MLNITVILEGEPGIHSEALSKKKRSFMKIENLMYDFAFFDQSAPPTHHLPGRKWFHTFIYTVQLHHITQML
jgi:hypothetical protein